ncbi:MAG: phosphate signaling complex protein PhoU [Candidatus Stygibacter australis]|nr:phosphate signaling complex protein PhoU [Candidatus Stygibacter australis]
MLEMKLNGLRKLITEEADYVSSMISMAYEGLFERNEEIFTEIYKLEDKLNDLEMQVEDDAIGLMALHQPEAKNLRTIVMIIKMNNDLERLGDHVVNITKCATRILKSPVIIKYIDLPVMFKETMNMMRDSIAAFINQDTELASMVMGADDLIDNLRDQIFRVNMSHMISSPETTPVRMQINEIASHLERIADLTTNICEEVVFMVKGRVVKHNAAQLFL